MAALNSDLRGLIHDENWNKHAHVQWVVEIANEISMDLVGRLRDIWKQDNYEDIMDKLIKALIGNPSLFNNRNWDRNLLSHFNMALLGLDDAAKKPGDIGRDLSIIEALNSLETNVVESLDQRNTRYYRNLNSILTDLRKHVHSNIHTHSCVGVGAITCAIQAPTVTLVGTGITTVLQRSLNYGNGTEEDNNFTRTWINDALGKANLTDEQIRVKDVILSDHALTAKVFGPSLQEEKKEEKDQKKEEKDQSPTGNHQHIDNDGRVYVHSHEHQNHNESLTENHQHIDNDGRVYVHSHEHQNQDEDHQDDHIRHLNENDLLLLLNGALAHEKGQMMPKKKMISNQDLTQNSNTGNLSPSVPEGYLGMIIL